MDYEKQTVPTIEAEAREVRRLLTYSDSGELARGYFTSSSEAMQEAAMVIDRRRVLYTGDLLTRNLVSACNNAGSEGLAMMSDAYKEVISLGSEITGVDLVGEDATSQSPARMLESLQIVLNRGLEMPVDLDPAVLKSFIDALMFANAQLLVRSSDERSVLTRNTDLQYYIDNIVTAKQNLEPKQ